jgi:hypothetical protein
MITTLRRLLARGRPLHLASVRHCVAGLLSPAQPGTLAGIAGAITSHLAAEHSGTPDG